jgi:dihydrofolate reductase
MQFAGEGMSSGGSLLFGRRTYEDLLGFWSTTPDPNPFTEVLLNSRKYVVSRSPETVLAYPNSTLLAGDAAGTVAALDQEATGGLTILGSRQLVQSLHAAGLIDQYILLVHPVVLGSGTKLFGDGERLNLTLQRSITTTTGVIIAQYSTR